MAKIDRRRRSSGKAASDTNGGEFSTYLLLGLGVLGLVAFFLPWYADTRVTLSGFDLLRGYDVLQHVRGLSGADAAARRQMYALLAGVGGVLFVAASLLVVLAGAALGGAWTLVYRRLGERTADLTLVLAAGIAAVGMVWMLVLLNQKIRGHVLFGGYAFVLLAYALAAVLLWGTRELDVEAGRTIGALDRKTWGAWLGGLAVTAAVHYWLVCRVIIEPAPQFLQNLVRSMARRR